MNPATSPIVIATRGSALALAQAELILAQCREAFPRLTFEIRIIKTTGDKLQTASLVNAAGSVPKGLFTKELEAALERHEADLAVHSLKDLPTELPAGLKLGAVGKRADVRDVLVQRATEVAIGIADLPRNATVATSSTRRKAQLLLHRPDLNVVEIRGNVGTRLQKLVDNPKLDGIVLAAAGLGRLNFVVTTGGKLQGDGVPGGLLAAMIEVETMLPCAGQGALGIEVRAGDERVAAICERLDHYQTHQCVQAERAFLNAMGGGCQSPIAAYADVLGEQIRLRVVSFHGGTLKCGEAKRGIKESVALGEQLAGELKT